MSLSRSSLFVGALALVAGSVLASTACAADAILVSYSDLDVSTHPGVAELYTRIHSAAAASCAPERGRESGGVSADYDRCIRQTTAATVQAARIPRLTALHQTRTGSRYFY